MGLPGRPCPYTREASPPNDVCYRCAIDRREAAIALGYPCSPPCDDDNCTPCAVAECPTGDVLHRHGDGCPSCFPPGDEDDTIVVPADRPTATEEP